MIFKSLRYAHAKKILISGRLDPDRLEIKVEDDGIGLKPGIRLRLNDLLASKHFGLAGMHERANLTGAELTITSTPNEGMQIRIRWKTDKT